MYTLPDLPYPYEALEPFIDRETMMLHHDKHHASYVENLNKALEGHEEFSTKSIEDLLRDIEKVPEEVRQSVVNNGGGHVNHSLFWEIMKPKGGGKPEGELLSALEKTFSSFEKLQEEFTKKAMGVFGSGWAFLVVTPQKELLIKRHSFQNSPYMQKNIPIFGIDVWEHAYYLKYQNRKKEYVDAFWNVVNWAKVAENFKKASS